MAYMCKILFIVFFSYMFVYTTAKDISIDVSKMLLLLIFNRHCMKCFSLKGMLTLLLKIVIGYHTIKLSHYKRKSIGTDHSQTFSDCVCEFNVCWSLKSMMLIFTCLITFLNIEILLYIIFILENLPK